MKRRIMKLSLILSVPALFCFVPSSTVRATYPGFNGRIAFTADTGNGYQIYTVRPNGHDLRQITQLGGDSVHPGWSPDGRRIVFEHDQGTENVCANIAIMNADGSNLVEFVQAPNICEGSPSFTPDGSRVVFEHFDIDTGADAILSMKINGSGRRQIISPFPNGFATDPHVSPDGKTLSFAGWDGNLVGPPPLFEPALALFTSRIDGSHLSQLTPFSIDLAVKQDWAPDGQQIVVTTNANFFDPGQSANIATIRPRGSNLHYLTHFEGGEVNAFVGSYSPDERWIVFRLEDYGQYGLYKMRADGTGLKPILGLSGLKPRFIDWGPRSEDENDDDDNQDRR